MFYQELAGAFDVVLDYDYRATEKKYSVLSF